jgi:hypothetical protein
MMKLNDVDNVTKNSLADTVPIAYRGWRNREIHTHVGKLSGFKLVPQGAIAGFLDAIGGGGWGPKKMMKLNDVDNVTKNSLADTVPIAYRGWIL